MNMSQSTLRNAPYHKD